MRRWYDGTKPLKSRKLGNYLTSARPLKDKAEYLALSDEEMTYALQLQRGPKPDDEGLEYCVGAREKNWLCYINSPNDDEEQNVHCHPNGE